MTTPNFQLQVLSLLAQDRALLDGHRHAFSPEYFESTVYGKISKLFLDFYDKHQGPPSKSSMTSMVEMLVLKRQDEAMWKDEYMSTVKSMYRPILLPDKEFVLKNLEESIRNRKFQLTLLDSTEADTAEKRTAAASKVTDAANFSFARKERMVSFGKFLRDEYLNALAGVPIPTGFYTMDQEMHGGLRPGELGIFCGTSNTGKSQVLINVAAAAIKAGKRVLIITLEMSELQVIQRLDACIFHHDYWDLAQIPNVVTKCQQSVNMMRLKYPSIDDCNILFEPAGSLTVQDLYGIISSSYAADAMPDLIIVDYADLLRSTTSYDSSYETIGLIYQDLFGFSKRLNIPVWTASQTNREGSKVKLADLQHVAESFKKAFVADTVYTLNQEDWEKARHIMRVYSAKQRNHSKGSVYYFKTQFEQSTMVPITLGEYTEIKNAEPIEKFEVAKQLGGAGVQKKILEMLNKHKGKAA